MKTGDSAKIFTFTLLLLGLNFLLLVSLIPCLFLAWTYYMYRSTGKPDYFLLMNNVCKYYGIVISLGMAGLFVFIEQSLLELFTDPDSMLVYVTIIIALLIYFSCKYFFIAPISNNLEYLTENWKIKRAKVKTKKESHNRINENLSEELQHLSDLVSKGAITSEEYENLKKKLIDERLSS